MAGGISRIQGNGLTVEISATGVAPFTILPFLGDISISGGEAPTSEIVTFQGIGRVTGEPRVQSVSIVVPSYIPTLGVWNTINTAADNGSDLTFRFTTQEQTPVFAANSTGNTVSIATSGVVSFAGSSQPDLTLARFQPGQVISTSGADYQIEIISDAGVATVTTPPTTAVSAAQNYSIKNPARRLEFVGQVATSGNLTLPAEGVMNTTITINPNDRLPAWTLVA